MPLLGNLQTAKKSATSTYLPVLVSLDILHFFLIYKRGLSTYRKIITIVQWVLTYFSYQGIISDAQQGSYASEKKLAGGAWLDLLFIVLLSQFGSVFIHEGFMDSMLIVLPALYSLVKYLMKAGDSGEEPLTKQDEETKRQLEERRRKRAERRRQKRA